MKLKIERTVGETWESYDMEGDYEEILTLATELGFCKGAEFNPSVIVDTDKQKISTSQILHEFVKSKCPGCKHE